MGGTSANGNMVYCVWNRGLAIFDSTVCRMGNPILTLFANTVN